MNPTNCLGWALTIAFLVALVLRAARGSTRGGVRPFWKRAWELWLSHPWPWLLAHPLGGLVYVLITVLGPALLGVPNLVPKNLIWLMLGLIGLASVYGVKKTGRDARLRDEALLERIEEVIGSAEGANAVAGEVIESAEGRIRTRRRRIEAAERRIKAAEGRVKARRRRVEALREEE